MLRRSLVMGVNGGEKIPSLYDIPGHVGPGIYSRFRLCELCILGMNGPRPSTRAFLCDLPCLPADAKIRFLGWYVNRGSLGIEIYFI